MAAAVDIIISTIGSSIIYSDLILTVFSTVPVVTTIIREASTVLSTVVLDNTVTATLTSSGNVVTTAYELGGAYLTSVVVPGETIVSTGGFAIGSVVTSPGRIAVSTIPFVTTIRITDNAAVSVQAPPATTSSLSSPSTSSIATLPSSSRSSSTFATSVVNQSAPGTSSSLSTNGEINSAPSTSVTVSSTRSSHHLPPGAIAGIAVGVVVGLLIVIVAILCLVRRRRRRTRSTATTPRATGIADKAELVGSVPPASADRSLAGVLPTRTKPELDAGVTRHVSELANDSALTRNNRASTPISPVIYEAPAPLDRASTTYSNTPLIPPPPPPSTTENHVHPDALNRQSQLSYYNPDTHAFRPAHESTSPKFFVSGPDPGPDTYFLTNAHHQRTQSWLNQARHEDPQPPADTLSQLRAEHEALMDRIRLAEQRERDRQRNS